MRANKTIRALKLIVRGVTTNARARSTDAAFDHLVCQTSPTSNFTD